MLEKYYEKVNKIITIMAFVSTSSTVQGGKTPFIVNFKYFLLN